MEFDRSNTDEFLSFLGTCMTFYNMHLTPYEQSHVIAEMGKILHDHLAPKNYAPLVKFIYGETHAKTPFAEGGETDGKNDL